jgi:xylulose-5-phosphate/fructose-6-phosphate phosphoketolase
VKRGGGAGWGFSDEILGQFPDDKRKMGFNWHTMPKDYPALELPRLEEFLCTRKKESDTQSLTELAGQYLAEVCRRNPKNFRIFSPDELDSNKLSGVLEATNRNMQWAEETANKGGRVIEILSEHTCQGWAQGYTLTGRYALFPSYETFLGIITTMMIQYAKFIKIAKETGWRTDVPSLNYIETSTLWRQEHNGYSHQDPMFINNLINMKKELVRIYLPPDANTFLYALEHVLQSKGEINLLVGTKQPMPIWLNPDQAKLHFTQGASVWKWLSDEGEPDVVLCGCGNEVTLEVVTASKMLRQDAPGLNVRVVNVLDLMSLDLSRSHSHSMDMNRFDELFTADRPVVFAFHGYPSVIHQLLFGRTRTSRFHVLGYIEEGTTTTPFAMLTSNRVSRYHIAIEALTHAAAFSAAAKERLPGLRSRYESALADHDAFIQRYGKDPEWLASE